MPWQPGQSGNPAGPKVGSGRISKLRAMLEKGAPDLIEKVMQLARAGDISALRLCLNKVLPDVRPCDAVITIPRPDSGDTVDQSHYVLDSMLSGGLPADTAVRVMQTLMLHQTMGELKELERRIALLERDDNEHS